MPRTERQHITVRCSRVDVRRVDGQVVAHILSCGHEVPIHTAEDKTRDEWRCNTCTIAKYGKLPSRKYKAK